MAQSINQFGITLIKGSIDLIPSPNVIPCQVGSGQSGSLVNGQAVKLDNTDLGGVPKVVAVAADTDPVFGFIPYSTKINTYVATDLLEIASDLSVIYLEASAAIARGASVMYVVSGQKVVTATVGSKTIVGVALDKATASGDFIRIQLKPGVSAAS